jgi:hypothetical protein
MAFSFSFSLSPSSSSSPTHGRRLALLVEGLGRLRIAGLEDQARALRRRGGLGGSVAHFVFFGVFYETPRRQDSAVRVVLLGGLTWGGWKRRAAVPGVSRVKGRRFPRAQGRFDIGGEKAFFFFGRRFVGGGVGGVSRFVGGGRVSLIAVDLPPLLCHSQQQADTHDSALVHAPYPLLTIKRRSPRRLKLETKKREDPAHAAAGGMRHLAVYLAGPSARGVMQSLRPTGTDRPIDRSRE